MAPQLTLVYAFGAYPSMVLTNRGRSGGAKGESQRPVKDPLGDSLAGGVVAGRLFDGELCRDDCPKVQGGQKGHHLVIAGRKVLELGIIAKRWKQCFLPWFERW